MNPGGARTPSLEGTRATDGSAGRCGVLAVGRIVLAVSSVCRGHASSSSAFPVWRDAVPSEKTHRLRSTQGRRGQPSEADTIICQIKNLLRDGGAVNWTLVQSR